MVDVQIIHVFFTDPIRDLKIWLVDLDSNQLIYIFNLLTQSNFDLLYPQHSPNLTFYQIKQMDDLISELPSLLGSLVLFVVVVVLFLFLLSLDTSCCSCSGDVMAVSGSVITGGTGFGIDYDGIQRDIGKNHQILPGIVYPTSQIRKTLGSTSTRYRSVIRYRSDRYLLDFDPRVLTIWNAHSFLSFSFHTMLLLQRNMLSL